MPVKLRGRESSRAHSECVAELSPWARMRGEGPPRPRRQEVVTISSGDVPRTRVPARDIPCLAPPR